jgi:hypothetical protein
MKLACLLLICIFMQAGALFAGPLEEGWTLAKDSDSIKVYTKPIPGSPLDEFMGDGDVDAPIEVIEQVLLDFPSYPEWYGMCKEARKIKTLTDKPNHYYLYYVVNSPWPVSNRDVVLEVVTDDMLSEGKLTININALKDQSLVPVDKKCVRMTHLVSKIMLNRVDSGKTHMTYMVDSDPAGSVPSGIAQKFAKDQPFKTIQGLREMVKKDIYYQKAGKTKKD